MISNKIGELEKTMNHIYQEEKFGENWFDFQDLYSQFVQQMNDGDIFVEVGCWKGKSVSYIAVEIINSSKDIKCYAIDTWRGSKEHQNDNSVASNSLYELFLDNIEPVKNVVVPVRKSSLEAVKDFADGSINVVYIDASHEYDDVKADILAWLPKVKRGGILAGHDYTWESVKKAVDETLGENSIQRHCVSSWSYRV